MGSALRILVLFIAMIAIAASVVAMQLWAQQRSSARLQKMPAAATSAEWREHLSSYRQDQQVAMIVTVFASFTALAAVMMAAGFGQGGDHRAALAPMQRERGEVEHLARANAEQTTALLRERDVRQRAEENLLLQQLITNQALNEKIRISRDLHDGIIQSLYATGLILESGLKKQISDPAQATVLFEKSREMLNTSIRDVRNYIRGLVPDPAVDADDFKAALTAVIEPLGVLAEVRFDLQLEPVATSRVQREQMPDLLQITREAVSNAIRHGQAKLVAVHLREDGRQLCLLVEDDGQGFDPVTVSSLGYGLKNLQARAELLRGQLRLTSQLGAGTRVVLTFPVVAPHGSTA